MNDFFLVHFRELVEKGHLYLAKPPLYLIKDGKQKRFISNKQEFEKFMVSKVFDKFKLGIKDEPLTKKSLREVFNHFDTYLYDLKQASSKYALNQELFEYICIVYKADDTKGYVKKILKKYDELKSSTPKNGHILLEGLIGNSYQNVDLNNEEFIDSIKSIKRYYKDYGTAYIQVDGVKTSFMTFLKDANNRAVPPGTKIERFKGLGGMESEQLGETTLDPKTRTLERVTISSLTKAIETSEKLMGSDPDERKSFLMSFKINPDDIDT